MKNKFEYIISTFWSIYNIDNKSIDLNYGIDGKTSIQISKGQTDFFNTVINYNIENVIWKEWEGVNIPFLFDTDDTKEIITQSNGFTIINYDIISSAFFFLSNWQEWSDNTKETNISRFPYRESIQFKLKIIDKPIVNYYFSILKHVIESTYGYILQPKSEFITFISHDIDNCLSAWIQGSFRAILKKDLFTPFKLIFLKLFKEDAWFNFNEILEIEHQKNIHSTFFFLSKNGRKGKLKNSDYSIKHKKFKAIFNNIENSQCEVGLHGSIGTSISESGFKNDISDLNFNVIGNRFHFLEFDTTKTIDVLVKSNIRYDCSMGFAEHPGFRNGICHPFYLYDISNDRSSGILEIPLILMDGSLQNKKYINIDIENSAQFVLPIISEVKKFNGVFSLLWHNTHYSEYKYSGWRNVFFKIYDICKQKEASFLSGREIFKIYGFKN